MCGDEGEAVTGGQKNLLEDIKKHCRFFVVGNLYVEGRSTMLIIIKYTVFVSD